MVIGNGMVANKFQQYLEDRSVVIFGSGVSNSKTKDVASFLREELLLTETINTSLDKHIVYFSTCSIYDPSESQSLYVRHKLKMEEIIKSNAPSFNIFRASNVVGKTNNQYTIFNFYIRQIESCIPFELWKFAERNLIDVDHVFSIVHFILQRQMFKNQIVNIANRTSYPVQKIVTEIELFLGINAQYQIIEKGSSFGIDTNNIDKIIEQIGIRFDENYIQNLLKSYYS